MGLPEGAVVPLSPDGTGLRATISYVGGVGHDVTLTIFNPLHNTRHGIDVDGDRILAPIDALLVINFLNDKSAGPGPVPANAELGPPFFDVDDDGIIAPIDALTVINSLNAGVVLPTTISLAGPQGEAAVAAEAEREFLALIAAEVAFQTRRRRG